MIQPDTTRERPNPNATIGFVISYPFQFYVYKNVYQQLATESEFIIDLGAYALVRQSPDMLENIVRLLEKHAASYRVLDYDDYLHESYLQRFFERYHALVALWERGCVMLPCNDERRKITLTYGAGKDINIARPNRGIFDLVLAYGPRDQKLCAYFTNSVIVGNPKFDDWFNNDVSMDAVAESTAQLDPAKKTVLYLPTHSDLSSIDTLSPALKRLADKYNIIAKSHYFTAREEPERFALLQELPILCDDSTDLLPLLKLSDVVVSDNSSAIFDAILADKSVVVADFWDAEYLDDTHQQSRTFRRGIQPALTFSGSIEQKIKRNGTVITISRPDELERTLEDALRDVPELKQKRATLRTELFSFNDGKCGERAAQAIHDCIAKPRTSERPLLFHVFQAVRSHFRILTLTKERNLNRRIELYEAALRKKAALLGEKKFSIVLVRKEGINSDIERESLRSLMEQNFSPENYEILIVNGPGMRRILRDGRARASVDVIECDSAAPTIGMRMMEAVEQAKAPILCFTTSTHAVSSSWLVSLFSVYEANSDISGAGGYARRRGAWTSVDECEHFEIAKRMNVHRENLYLSKLFAIKSQLMYSNPAGILGNISYRKEALDIEYIRGAFTFPSLEVRLKASALAHGPIFFLPEWVYRLDSQSVRALYETVRAKVFAYQIETRTLRREFFCKGSVISISDVLHQLRRGNVAHASVFFVAWLASLVGSLQGYAFLAASLLQRKAEDIRRGM